MFLFNLQRLLRLRAVNVCLIIDVYGHFEFVIGYMLQHLLLINIKILHFAMYGCFKPCVSVCLLGLMCVIF